MCAYAYVHGFYVYVRVCVSVSDCLIVLAPANS